MAEVTRVAAGIRVAEVTRVAAGIRVAEVTRVAAGIRAAEVTRAVEEDISPRGRTAADRFTEVVDRTASARAAAGCLAAGRAWAEDRRGTV